jgi:hypothetical protein
MTVETAPVRQRSDVIVFRNLAPVENLDSLPEESKRALAEFRTAMGVGSDVDLSGDWWGVLVLEQRRFHRCDTQKEAEALGMQLGRQIGSAVWLEANGHPSAKFLASFR